MTFTPFLLKTAQDDTRAVLFLKEVLPTLVLPKIRLKGLRQRLISATWHPRHPYAIFGAIIAYYVRCVKTFL